MNVETIEMTVSDAKEKLDFYRKKLARVKFGEANSAVAKEYKALMDGYRQLSKGVKLIDVEDAFLNCPTDEKFRPRLAIARADAKEVCLISRETWSIMRFSTDAQRQYNNWSSGVRAGPRNIIFSKHAGVTTKFEGYSIVPIVPLEVLPERGQLKDMFILWEVEKWADAPEKKVPDKDPYLLKHLSGPIYAIIGEWDLTELERALMKGRIRE